MNVFFKLIHGLGWMVNWGRCNYNALHLNIFRVNNVSSIQNTMWYKLGVYSILQNKYRPYVYYFLINFSWWSGKENKPKHQKCFKSGPSILVSNRYLQRFKLCQNFNIWCQFQHFKYGMIGTRVKIAPSLYHLERIDNVVKTATPPPNEWPVITKRYPGYVLKALLRIWWLNSITLSELSAIPLWTLW